MSVDTRTSDARRAALSTADAHLPQAVRETLCGLAERLGEPANGVLRALADAGREGTPGPAFARLTALDAVALTAVGQLLSAVAAEPPAVDAWLERWQPRAASPVTAGRRGATTPTTGETHVPRQDPADNGVPRAARSRRA